jgi:alkane 1-monooxygenase
MGVDAGGTFERKHDLKEFASIQSHGGLGLAVTDKGILVNVLVHFAAYLPSALCIIGTIWGGWWTWLTFIVGWVAVPIFDLLIGADSYNLTPEEEKAWAASVWFRVVTWFHFPIQVVTVTFGAYWVGTQELSWLEWLGITFSIGTAEGFGIGCVHELIHRPHTIDFMSGVLSLVWSNYGHFWIEHLWGHHRNVASPLDPASSDVGDNAWVFVAKCMWKSFFEAWGIESKILKSRGKGTFSPENRIIQAYLLTWTVAGAYYHFFGVQALPFFFAQGFIAAWIVDNTNYIEHYGLRRKEIKPGVFERVGWLHAWDTPELLTNSLLFKIQRHPDHHTNAGRPYQILRTFPQAPTLPTGYAGMIVLSWFPPLYWYVMNWRVELVKEQEREFRATGKILGEDYPFPDGARAVYSFDSEADKLFIPSDFVEKSTTNQPKFDQYKALKSGHQGLSEYSRNRATRGALLFLLVALLGVAAAVSFSEAGGPLRLQVDRALQGLPRPSLFERLGGLEGIKPLVHSIYLKHKLDPITGEWFEGKDHAAIEQRVVEFFAAGTGGSVEYTGRDLLELHKNMKVTGEAFLAVQEHVLTSLEEFGHGQALRDEVLGVLFSLKPVILPNHKPITGKDLPSN